MLHQQKAINERVISGLRHERVINGLRHERGINGLRCSYVVVNMLLPVATHGHDPSNKTINGN
jgi:hypothetical protein